MQSMAAIGVTYCYRGPIHDDYLSRLEQTLSFHAGLERNQWQMLYNTYARYNRSTTWKREIRIRLIARTTVCNKNGNETISRV